MNDRVSEDLFVRVARVAAEHRASAGDRPVAGTASREDAWAAFDLPLPEDPTPADQVVDELLAAAEGHLVGSVGPRYFGFVVGGSTPAATAADLLAVGWDQNAFNPVLSPAAEAAERAAGGWVKDLLGLPGGASVGFVTGAQAANTVGIACGRHRVLEQAGHDVETDGLVGAPRVRVVTGSERHATIDRSLRLLGLGTASLVPVLTDDHGTIDLADLEQVLGQEPDRPTIVCLQAGNVNTGASDLFAQAVPLAKEAGAWVHVDGAFGLWAAAAAGRAHLVAGVEEADSWATDAHKWLNVPYDSGLAIVADPVVHGQSMAYSAAYLAGSGRDDFSLGDLVPDSSRRARGFAVWAALRELGRSGVEDLVERTCVLAARMAARLAEGGATIANDVVLNQVLVGFGDLSTTDEIVAEVQRDGTCWVGATTWHHQRLIRISVSNATTTEHDIDRSADAILAAAEARSAPASLAAWLASVLRDQEFLRYFASRLLSVAGSIVTLVTLPIIVYRTSGSASLTALVAAAEAAPYLLFGLFSGALTDRWNRKKVMVTADVLSTLLVATVPLADLLGELTVPHVLAVAFLGPTIGVFFDGAVFGALPTLVGRQRIAEANSLTWAAASVVEMAMPSAVGVLLAFVHPAWLLGFDALTFALSAVLIGGISRPMYDAVARASAPHREAGVPRHP